MQFRANLPVVCATLKRSFVRNFILLEIIVFSVEKNARISFLAFWLAETSLEGKQGSILNV